jgi:hypothetical protein
VKFSVETGFDKQNNLAFASIDDLLHFSTNKNLELTNDERIYNCIR